MILNKKIVFILGMHRSGTSCLAGILKERGCEIGNFDEPNLKSNPKGNQENPEIFKLNERILKINGGSWNKPKNKDLIITDRLKNKIESIKFNLLETNERKLYLIKDPRMLFCLQFWLEENSKLVGTIRNPIEVVKSLKKRNEFANKKLTTNWMWLWLQYNKRLLQLHNKYNFPIVNFSWDTEKYNNETNLICKKYLQLDFDDNKVPFLDNKLKHHIIDDEEIINIEAKALYATLSNIADNSIK